MPLEPDKITHEHVEKAIKRIQDENIDLIPSTGYDVIIEGKKYPPKDVMRYAHEEMNGEHIWKKGGGESTNKYFKRMGFEVVEKQSNAELYELKENFLDEWPLDRVNSMILDEYTNLNKEDSFCYWLETKMDELGSIYGGSAYKFGIYKRQNMVSDDSRSGYLTDGEYAWVTKYGNTAEEAFENVRSIIVSVIESAQSNQLNRIDHIDLGDAVKWKIAFQYSHYTVINIFKTEAIRKVGKKTGLKNAVSCPISEIHNFLIDQKPEHKGYYNYTKELWSNYSGLDKPPKNNSKPNDSLNQILYGPPGTGKTYALRTEYAPHFTQGEKLKTKIEFEVEIIESLSWWEVAAMVLLEKDSLTVPEIKDHRFIKIKENISNTKSVHATLWGQLQTHTSPDSKNVNTSNRQEPFIFEKKEGSVWTVNMENCRQKTPYLLDHLDKMENYTSEFNETQNYRFTTFHQSFTYEDFVEGIKPVLHEESDEANDGELGYRIEKGIFYQAADEACKLAGFLGLQDCLSHTNEERNKKFSEAAPYALFIDEINRGNISAILGELITLIEQDKRLTKGNELIVRLPYSKSKFAVPPNLYILGTLNTADRSVEALDTALRRRFSFLEIEPDPELLAGVFVEDIDIQVMFHQINLRIEKLLDRDHRIGHSYFLPLKKNPTLDRLKLIFTDRIIPLLKEYFFGDFGKIGLVLGISFIDEVQSDGSNIFADFPGYEDVSAEYEERKVFKISPSNKWDFKSIYIPKTDAE